MHKHLSEGYTVPASWKKWLIAQSDLMNLHEQVKAKGKKIAFTAGSWDLLHVGQCRYLEEARSHGDVLVVGVSSNEAIDASKAPINRF